MRDIRPFCYLIRRLSQLEKGEKRNSDEREREVVKELGRPTVSSETACTVWGHDSIQGVLRRANHTARAPDC